MPNITRRTALATGAAALTVAATAVGAIPAAAAPAAAAGPRPGPVPPKARPTIVLVHGAFADASGWSLVGAALQAEGYPVLAFANPLRGITYDSAYLRDFLGTVEGPTVLVGHSYGGAVITDAATGDADVNSLVYIAAYALDEGESVAQANELGGGHTDVIDHLVVRPFPGATPGDADAYIDPEWFPRLFAQDLPKVAARTMAASQRPGAFASLLTPSGVPAWRTIPSWYLVATEDRIIPPQAERVMAARAGATTMVVRSSHVPMISQPLKVLSLIRAAAR